MFGRENQESVNWWEVWGSLCLSGVFSFDRTSMCSSVEFVIVPCQPLLCNACIKEKLTLIVQLITDGHRQTDRRTDRWTHPQTSKGDQLVPSSICVCVHACMCLICCQAAIKKTYAMYSM